MNLTGIHLVTGGIGAGKTLMMIGYMRAMLEAGRPVYACNFDDLNVPGVIEITDPNIWPTLVPGSVLFVDEVQKFWPVRRSGVTPPALALMNEARKIGVTLVLVTQLPKYIDSHIRGLVTFHEHLYRRGNLPASEVMSWERVAEKPMSFAERGVSSKRVYRHNKEDQDRYKSANIHTVKVRIPLKMKLAVLGLIVSVVMFAWIFKGFFKDEPAPAVAQVSESAPPSAPAALPAGNAKGTAGDADHAVRSPADFFTWLTPYTPGTPWSAPAYQGRPVAAEPELYCMSSGAGVDGNGDYAGPSCTCQTEQGTRAEVPDDLCRDMARKGPIYNPYRKPIQLAKNGDSVAARERPQTATSTSSGVGIDAAQGVGNGRTIDSKLSPIGGI